MAKCLQRMLRSVSVLVFISTDFSCNNQGEKCSQKAMNPIRSRCPYYYGVDGPQKSLCLSIERLEKQLSLEA